MTEAFPNKDNFPTSAKPAFLLIACLAALLFAILVFISWSQKEPVKERLLPNELLGGR